MSKKPPFTPKPGAPTGALGASGKAKDYLPRRERTASELDTRPGKDKPKRPGQKPVDNRPRRPGPLDARKRVQGVVAAKAAPQPKTHTHWGDVADWYDALVGDDGSEYHRKVIIPGVLRMLELNKIEADRPQILDLACGQGVLCRRLAEEGCEVTGVDAAAPLLDAARKRNLKDKLAIKYTLADVTELLAENGTPLYGLRAGSYDAVTIVL